MSDKQKKYLGIVGLVLAAVAGALMKSPLGDQHGIHLACEIALQALSLLGFSSSASAFAKQPAPEGDK